ncbi:GGDEF domain-containing protein [Bacillus sp. SG-1]|uniref:GGDEF domain-containing protein n=1 Tax=Bacillus sp. SG-1 TaxID=161544 RepID=UPI000154329E|nr:GGDEF domain-containing protein [Bacillus sp. SG-1]EDL65248.1 Signal transduction protein containing diguanylate cyclase/phosphodiesterase domain (GGDEF) and domain [Bacillus sp. SG-1]
MKQTIYLKNSLLGLVFFSLLFWGSIFLFRGDIHSFGISGLSISAIASALILQFYAFKRSEGLQRSFLSLLLFGTVLYAGAKSIWLYEEGMTATSTAVPFWIELFYIFNILIVVAAFLSLTYVIKNRYQVIYFAIDILIIYFSITAILWVFWLHPLYQDAGVAYEIGASSFINPALELLLLLALLTTMFVKKYFLPMRAMLLFTISIALLFIGDSFGVLSLFYGRIGSAGIPELLGSAALILQGIGAVELLKMKAFFRKGENNFNYEAGAYPAARNIVNIGSILTLFLVYSSSGDMLAGAALLLIVFLVYSRQLLTGSQLKKMTASYQNLAMDLENQVNIRTEELRKKNSELKRSSSRLKYMALHDQLTEIWNRRALESRLQTLFERSLDDEEVKFAVLFIDIDKFKEINDRLGHSYGDELLIEFTKRVKREFPPDAFIARQSGDEFVVILEGRQSKDEIEGAIQKFFAANEEGYTIFGEEVHITFSLGASFFPEDSRNMNELLQAADMAMYDVKQQGRNNYQIN